MEDAIKMTRDEYQKIHRDFRARLGRKPFVLRSVGGKGTCFVPVEFTDEPKAR